MKRAKRFLTVFIIILAVVLIAAYLLINVILEAAARQAIDFAAKILGREGVELINPGFKKVVLSFPLKLSIRDFSSRIVVSKDNVFQLGKDFLVDIKSASIALRSISKGEFIFMIEDGLIVIRQEAPSEHFEMKEKQQNKFRISYLTLPFRIDFFKIKDAVAEASHALKDIAALAKTGQTNNIGIDMRGFSEFSARNILVKGRLFFVRYGNEKKLIMDPKDFLAICQALGEQLTQFEFIVYCDNPLRMPRMLQIRDYASDRAYEEHKLDPNVVMEVYKHILWAYLLALAYDEKFSTEVTDSHELDAVGRSELSVRTYLRETRHGKEYQDPAGPKVEEESQMDLVNNAIGRKYARYGFDESRVRKEMMVDPDVIRSPYEINPNYSPTKDNSYFERLNSQK